MKDRAFSPGHVTGLFAIERGSEALRQGSLGAGVNISRGVLTLVDAELNGGSKCRIRINGVETEDAYTSLYAAERIITMSRKPYRVIVDHFTDLPIGAGFGTSGAGALSLSLALNQALSLGLSDVEAAQIAHEAEIACGTGLGTVPAELQGGLELRESAGAPGVGRVSNLRGKRDLTFISFVFGAMPTPAMLSDKSLQRRANRISLPLLEELRSKPTARMLVEQSERFTDTLGLATPRLREALNILRSSGYPAGMAMFGEALFTLVEEGEVSEVLKLLERFESQGRLMVSRIGYRGAFAF